MIKKLILLPSWHKKENKKCKQKKKKNQSVKVKSTENQFGWGLFANYGN